MALSHADMVGDGAKGLQVEGTATAKTLKWEHTLFFREYQEGHSASYPFIVSQVQIHPSVPAL